VIQAAIAKAPTSEAKAAAGKAAAAKVQAQQNAAAAEAKKEQAQAQQQAAENRANLAKVQRMEAVQLDRDTVLASSSASQKALIPADLGTFTAITREGPNLGTGV
jgi:hypothetical protein